MQIEEMYDAIGITRTRFAEILYEHEGFVDHEHGRGAPNREVPEWIEYYLSDRVEHHGDCVKLPCACMKCHAKYALDQADELMTMVMGAIATNG